MREITRIHIAKIAYDIELEAKKDLENYVKALERYANDQEILDDIEIRITELLAERGVIAGGVITSSDVAAVRGRLGEPSDFVSEDTEQEIIESGTENLPRRVYRDESEAILGGVLAGLGKFFGIDPLWLRLLFIVVLLASGGTAFLFYVILWIIIPPAQTAAERLQMNGHPVTLASIKKLSASVEHSNEIARTVRRALSLLTGSILVLMAVGGVLAIIRVIFEVQFGPTRQEMTVLLNGELYNTWWFMATMGLFVISGLLFSILCLVLANAAFRRQWSKKTSIAITAIMISGIVTFVGGIGVGMYGRSAAIDRIEQLRDVTSSDLSQDFMNARMLVVDEDNIVDGDIRYEVSDKPYYTLNALPGVKADIKLSDDGKTIKVALREETVRMYSTTAPLLTVYGPALDVLNLRSDSTVVFYKNEKGQDALSIDARNSGSRFNLAGEYRSVKIVGDAYSDVSTEGATISDLSVDGGGVRAGIVRLLNIMQPDICPATGGNSMGMYSVIVEGVSGGKMIYNGEEKPATSISNGCGRVLIGDDEFDNED